MAIRRQVASVSASTVSTSSGIPRSASPRSDAAKCRVKVQEDFKELGGDTLDKLDAYIAALRRGRASRRRTCAALTADRAQQRRCWPNIPTSRETVAARRSAQERRRGILHAVGGVARPLSRKPLMLPRRTAAPRGPNYAPSEAQARRASEHLARLKAFHRYPVRVREPGQSGQADLRLGASSICWSRTMRRSSCESATSPRVHPGDGEARRRRQGARPRRHESRRCATPSRSTRGRLRDGRSRRNLARHRQSRADESQGAGRPMGSRVSARATLRRAAREDAARGGGAARALRGEYDRTLHSACATSRWRPTTATPRQMRLSSFAPQIDS